MPVSMPGLQENLFRRDFGVSAANEQRLPGSARMTMALLKDKNYFLISQSLGNMMRLAESQAQFGNAKITNMFGNPFGGLLASQIQEAERDRLQLMHPIHGLLKNPLGENMNKKRYEITFENIDGHVIVSFGCVKHVVHDIKEFKETVLKEACELPEIKSIFEKK